MPPPRIADLTIGAGGGRSRIADLTLDDGAGVKVVYEGDLTEGTGQLPDDCSSERVLDEWLADGVYVITYDVVSAGSGRRGRFAVVAGDRETACRGLASLRLEDRMRVRRKAYPLSGGRWVMVRVARPARSLGCQRRRRGRSNGRRRRARRPGCSRAPPPGDDSDADPPLAPPGGAR